MATPIIPRRVRGRLYFQTADILLPAFAQAAAPGAVVRAERDDIADQQQTESPLRCCDDCALNLGRDVLRALGACPRWGMVRAGIESRCPAFVAEDGAR